MRDLSRNFGFLVAYIVPGYIVLWGVSFLAPGIQWWLVGDGIAQQPSIAGFLHVTVASVAAGMTVSGLRWLVIDSLHHRTGIAPPTWSDVYLHERINGYEWLIENHYRYYQFYANSLIGLLIAYGCWKASVEAVSLGVLDVVVVVCCMVFYAGSRNTLERYYRRAESLLSEQRKNEMTNGGHPKPPKGNPKPTTKDPKEGEGKK